MEYKLVCIDIDGTLLNTKHKVTEVTKESLRKAHNKGVHIVISTGRMYTDARYYSDLIGVKSAVIASNGAFIKEKEEIIYKSVLEQELALKLIEVFAKYKVAPCFYTPHKFYCGSIFFKILFSILKFINVINQKIDMEYVFWKKRWRQILQEEKDNIVKCEVVHKNRGKLEKVRAELRKIEDIEIVSSSLHNIEITCKGVSKGRAVEILAGYYNLKAEQIIAIGDSENDLSMIEYAGLGIAMGNAIDKVKKKADFITASNDDDGVAKAVKQFVLKAEE